MNGAVELIRYSGRIQVLEDRSIRRDEGAESMSGEQIYWRYRYSIRIAINPMIWCEGDVPKLERYVLEARSSFGTSTRIRTKSLQANLQIANCNAVPNRTMHNDSRPTIATGKLCDHISDKGSAEEPAPSITRTSPDRFPIESGGSGCCLRGT